MRNERPDPIDALIDDAARRLVAGEPSSSLRSSVRDRIGRRRPVWLAVPAWGAAAAVVIAVLVVGRATPPHGAGAVGTPRSGPPAGPDKVRPTGDHPATNSNVPAVAQSIDPGATQPAQIEARQFTRRLATAVPQPPDEEPIVPPIAIEPLKTAQIAMDVSSGVMPIEIAPLQIEPLLGQ